MPFETPAQVNILNISLDKNCAAVNKLQVAGCSVFYVDHHFPGDTLPGELSFSALIDTQLYLHQFAYRSASGSLPP